MTGPLATLGLTVGGGDAVDGPFAEAVFLEPDTERLAVLGDLASATVDELLVHRRDDVIAWFVGAEGVHQTARVSPLAARRLHGAGIALYLLDVPELATLSDDIAAELGVPERNVQCTLFCNPGGSRTRAHFDPVHNVTVQLNGRKRWRVAPNRHAVLPTVGWATRDRQVPVELALHCHEQLPTEMDEDAAEFELTPGALLSIPRGWWHETVSDEPSISLHVHYEPILWVDTVLNTLRARLLREERWRRAVPLPMGAVATEGGEHLEHLAAAVRELTPADMITLVHDDRPTAATRPVTRVAGASFATIGPFGTTGEVEVEVVSPQPGAQRHTTLALTPAPLAAARRLAATAPTRALVSSDLLAQVPELTADQAGTLVDVLLRAGFVRPA